MQKNFLFGASAALVLVLTPSLSFAANLSNLNGLTTATQTFATSTTASPHLKIVSSGSTHTFQWNGVAWPLDQGGTGITTMATGSIPFINNQVFSENNSQLFWDTVASALYVGGTTTPAAKFSVKGSGSLPLFNLASSTGTSLFYVSPAGSVGIGTTNPLHALDIIGAIYSRLVTLIDGSTISVNWNNGNVQTVTLGGNRTLSFTNPQAGGEYKLILIQDATGGRTVSWSGINVKWPGGTAPTPTAAANSTDMVSFVYDGTNYLGTYASNFKTPTPPSTLLNNLVSYWKLDGNSNDSVGSLNGSDTTITYSSGNGILNNGAGFNSTSSTISLGTSSNMNVSGGAYSVCFWNKPNGSGSGPYGIISRREQNLSAHSTEGWTIVYANGANTQYQLIHVTSTGGTSSVSTSSSHPTGSWYQECVTVDGSGNVAWYTNGSADGTGTVTLVNNADSVNSYIGQGQDDSNVFLEDGAIDEVGVWSRALTSGEVTSLYNSGTGLQYPF